MHGLGRGLSRRVRSLPAVHLVSGVDMADADDDVIFLRALKTGGVEVAREKWDEADVQDDDEDDDMDLSPQTPRSARSILPDWTRSPLPAGAPPAKGLAYPPVQPTLNVVVESPLAAA